MNKTDLSNIIKYPLLLDGATGSNLLAAGMPRGVSTEMWILDHKDIFQDLQKRYIAAGSNVILAPTFGANRISLGLHNLEDQIETLNYKLVQCSKEIAGEHVLVAGDITTTGKMMEPLGDLTYEKAFDTYCEQIRLLDSAGIDFIIAETMINIEETLAAIDAAHAVSDLPIFCTVSVEADGSLFTGGNALEAALAFESAGAFAVGVNCSVGPDQLVSVIRNIKENVSIPVIAKPNAGMPMIDDLGNAIYSMNAQDFAKHIKVLVENGASIVGGCCGTTPEFIAETRKILNL